MSVCKKIFLQLYSYVHLLISGAYGSEEENRLESILDQTEEMRNRIVEANFKWRQAQMMVDYAHKQLDFAVAKWKDINEIDARYVNFVIISIFHFFHLNDIVFYLF